MDRQCPLGGDRIRSSRRVYKVSSSDAPFGEVRSEERHQNDVSLELYDRMGERFDVVGADGLVGFLDRYIVKNSLVDGTFKIRGEILRWNRMAAEKQGRETTRSSHSRVERTAVEALVVDAMKLCSRLDLM